jgi:tetratricopeptide (TPR) repeat protein
MSASPTAPPTRNEPRQATLTEQALRYQEELEKNPRDPQALVGISLIALQSRQAEAALDTAQAATLAAPTLIAAWVTLGQVLRALGRTIEAEQAFRHALSLDGMSVLALVGLGELKTATDNTEAALKFFDLALKRAPAQATIHVGRGHALACAGRFESALESYNQASALAPSLPDAHFAAGFALARLYRTSEAEARYRRALFLNPKFAAAWLNLGQLLYEAGRASEGYCALSRAVELEPTLVTGWVNLANLERDRGRISLAQAHLERAYAVSPTRIETLIALSQHAHSANNFATAWKWLDEAACHHPNHPEVYNTRGILLHAEDRFEEALDAFNEAEARGCFSAISNRGNVLLALGRVAEALIAHRAAVDRNPHHAGARYNLALTELRMGEWLAGWQNYEARWRFREVHRTPPAFKQPRWQGEPLEGRRILLHAEQGLGDTMQFCRYATLVAARGGQVILEVQPAVERLMRSLAAVHSGAAQLVARGSHRPAFDLECPLMSLPALFHTTLESVPWSGPYLAAEPALAALRKVELESQAQPTHPLRIGLSWAGNPRYKADKERSMSLATLLPLLTALKQAHPQVQLVSLQKGDAARQLGEVTAALNSELKIIDGSSLDEDFAETAALASHLDLILTTDTAIAHMGGAMGLPVWLLLPHHADWRWMEATATTPWYPTLRLFRQPGHGDWDGAFKTLFTEFLHFIPVVRERHKLHHHRT